MIKVQKEPSVWTDCGLQLRILDGYRKSLIYIRPLDRFLHHNLDGNMHTFDLIIDQANSGQKGSQILVRILIRSMIGKGRERE